MAQSNLKEKIIDFTNILTGGQTKSKQLYFQLKNSIDKAKKNRYHCFIFDGVRSAFTSKRFETGSS